MLAAVLLRHLFQRAKTWDGFMPRITDSMDVAAICGVVFCAMYLFSFATLPLTHNVVEDDAEVYEALREPSKRSKKALRSEDSSRSKRAVE